MENDIGGVEVGAATPTAAAPHPGNTGKSADIDVPIMRDNHQTATHTHTLICLHCHI